MKTRKLLPIVLVLILLVSMMGPGLAVAESGAGVQAVADDEYWANQFNLGVSYSPGSAGVYAIAVSGNNVYIGGDFDHAGNTPAANIAVWNSATHRWAALGFLNSRVNAIAVSGDYVYVGGFFSNAGGVAASCIARWNSITKIWSALGGGVTLTGHSPEVKAIAVAGNGDVYVGGSFDTAGGIAAANIARWDGSSWHTLGSGITSVNAEVDAIAINGSNVYVGGNFTNPAKNLALWNGSTWSAVGGGTDGDVLALAIAGGGVYVGGEFSHVNTSTAVGHVALWTGSTWNTLAGGVDDPDVSTIVVTDHGVFAGGRFINLADGSTDANRLAVWNGANWAKVGEMSAYGYNPGGGASSNVYALAYSSADDSLYLGGYMDKAGLLWANCVARWNFTDLSWYSLGDSVNGQVNAIATTSSSVYVGGLFTSAGGIPASGIARWNKSTGAWSALGTGIKGCSGLLCRPSVNAIAIKDNLVYIGGNFTQVGGVAANDIAVWNTSTSSWSALGGGVWGCTGVGCSTYVQTLLMVGTTVYAGGKFASAGSSTMVRNIAYYASATWYALGPGTGGLVRALAHGGSSTIVGGDFFTPGNFLVYWDGIGWQTVTGIGNSVYAIDGYGAYWLVGGLFTNAANSGANYLAKWNGAFSWTPLGSGVNGAVYSIDTRGENTYVGGAFDTAGLVGASHIAKWNGKTWEALGSGTNDIVKVVAVSGNDVYVGGNFTSAGGNPSFCLAHWNKTELYLPLVRK